MPSNILVGCARQGCRRPELRVPKVVTFDEHPRGSRHASRRARHVGSPSTVAGLMLATRHSAECRLGVIRVVSATSATSPVYPRLRTYCGIAAKRRSGPQPDS